MRYARPTVVLLAVISGCACGPSLAPPDAPAADAETAVDARLPTLDEPDVEPGERPSDDDDDWVDPPAPSDEPCCDVEPPVRVDAPDAIGHARPVVAWDGAEWGIAYRNTESTRFYRVSSGAERTMDPATLGDAVHRPWGMAWGGGRFGLVLNGDSPPSTEPATDLVIFDRTGVVARSRRLLERSAPVAIARYPLVHGWIVAHLEETPGSTTGEIALLDHDGSTLTTRAIPLLDGGRQSGVSVVSLRSRFVVVRASEDGPFANVFSGADASDAAEDVRLFDGPGDPMSATALRDSVVAVRTTVDGALESTGFDAFAPASPTVHHHLADATRSNLAPPVIAGDDEGGTALVAWRVQLEDGSADVFAAPVDETGTPLRAAALLVHLPVAYSLAVAASARDEFVVLVSTNTVGGSLFGIVVRLRR